MMMTYARRIQRVKNVSGDHQQVEIHKVTGLLKATAVVISLGVGNEAKHLYTHCSNVH